MIPFNLRFSLRIGEFGSFGVTRIEIVFDVVLFDSNKFFAYDSICLKCFVLFDGANRNFLFPKSWLKKVPFYILYEYSDIWKSYISWRMPLKDNKIDTNLPSATNCRHRYRPQTTFKVASIRCIGISYSKNRSNTAAFS